MSIIPTHHIHGRQIGIAERLQVDSGPALEGIVILGDEIQTTQRVQHLQSFPKRVVLRIGQQLVVAVQLTDELEVQIVGLRRSVFRQDGCAMIPEYLAQFAL